MSLPSENPAHIVFLFSDTGGGHRSAAQALIEALNLEFPGRCICEMIDIFRQYAPPPLHRAPDLYPPISRLPDMWELGYRVSDNPRSTRLIYDAIWPYVRWSVRRLVRENPADLIVSVHPLVNEPVLRAMRQLHLHVPYVTVVTDMVSTHVAWYDQAADRVIVPTEDARKRALKLGLRPERVRVIGLPVAESFRQQPEDESTIRARLGWPQDRPVILLVGGGEGMGPLEAVAEAINRARPQAALAVVAGRNKHLKSRLERLNWNLPTFIYGFVETMPDLMHAASVLVTKAGPGTISEAFIAGLPILLYSRMPGQEVGNVYYVVSQGAGVWAPEPEILAATLKGWIDHPEILRLLGQSSLRLARPDASRQIARQLGALAGLESA